MMTSLVSFKLVLFKLVDITVIEYNSKSSLCRSLVTTVHVDMAFSFISKSRFYNHDIISALHIGLTWFDLIFSNVKILALAENGLLPFTKVAWPF